MEKVLTLYALMDKVYEACQQADDPTGAGVGELDLCYAHLRIIASALENLEVEI